MNRIKGRISLKGVKLTADWDEVKNTVLLCLVIYFYIKRNVHSTHYHDPVDKIMLLLIIIIIVKIKDTILPLTTL